MTIAITTIILIIVAAKLHRLYIYIQFWLTSNRNSKGQYISLNSSTPQIKPIKPFIPHPSVVDYSIYSLLQKGDETK